MKTKILRILRMAEDSVSGQELCDSLGVSRTTVWKYINKLKEEGYRIEAVQNKGYRILEYPDIISESEIRSRLNTKWAGSQVVFFEQTDSTNNQAKRLGEEGGSHGTLVIAEYQNAGKGRRGRNWTSAKKTGIYMTLLLKPELPPSDASMLTLVAALSVSEAIEQITPLKPLIKWPNDVVLGGRKITGILTEMSAEMEEIHYVVVGIGINVNEEEFPEEIKEKATSLRIEGQQRIGRGALIAAFLECFEKNYDIFAREGDLSELVAAYNSRLINVKRTVTIIAPAGEYCGEALGINKRGALLVKRKDGSVEGITSGEVSVRGVYGYV